MQRKHVVVVVAMIVVLAAGGMLVDADRARLKASKSEPAARWSIPRNLPPVDKLPAQISLEKSLSVLQFDDGTCESGLGSGTTVTSWVEFDVPTQCSVNAGVRVLQITARFNTMVSGSQQVAVLGQAGPTAPPVGGGTVAGLTGGNFEAIGPCQAMSEAVEQRALVTPLTVTGTANFFFGLRNAGFLGRDTDGVPAGRIWLNCAACKMTQYSPGFLDGAGLGGNWMLRVLIEEADYVPCEFDGACCLEFDECVVITNSECVSRDGRFEGEGSNCDDPVVTCETLDVTMHSMSAEADGDSVVVRWTTEQEVDTASFRILREDVVGTGREKTRRTVLAGVVPAQGNSLEGASYVFEDHSFEAATSMTYRIQDIDYFGKVTDHGPITVDRGSRQTGRRAIR